jgi:hypothetical protein
MKYLHITLFIFISTLIIQGCSSVDNDSKKHEGKISWTQVFIESANPYKATDDSLNTVIDSQILSNIYKPVTELITLVNNGVLSNELTAAQIAQFVTNFQTKNPIANKILKEGSKNYRNDIVKVWNSIYEEYKSDPQKFSEEKTSSGQIYNVNELMKNWSLMYSENSIAIAYNSSEAMDILQKFAKLHDSLNDIRNYNYDRINDSFKKDLTDITRKVQEKDPEKFKNVNEDKLNHAVTLMMTRFLLDANGDFEELNKISSKVDRQISSILGFEILNNNSQ